MAVDMGGQICLSRPTLSVMDPRRAERLNALSTGPPVDEEETETKPEPE